MNISKNALNTSRLMFECAGTKKNFSAAQLLLNMNETEFT